MPSLEEVLGKFNDAFNRHDPDGMVELMTVDCLFENTFPPPDGARYRGRAAVHQFWMDFFQASEHARIDIEEVFFSGDRGVQRWVYLWQDAEGVGGHVRGVDIFRFRDGKIAEKLSYVKG